MNKLGFIGCGNMGKAMIGGIINSGQLKANEIIVSDLNEAALTLANEELGINTTRDSVELAKTVKSLWWLLSRIFMALY